VTAGTWARRAALAVGVWFAVCAAAFLLGLRPNPVLLALLAAAAGATLLLVLELSGTAGPARWRVGEHDPVRPLGEDPGLARLTRMVNAHLVSHEIGDRMHEHLLHLLDQRLVAHHGISAHADPGRAAGLLGPELAALVAQRPPYPRLTVDQIDVLIDRIEAL
jgi:hypothetical protein